MAGSLHSALDPGKATWTAYRSPGFPKGANAIKYIFAAVVGLVAPGLAAPALGQGQPKGQGTVSLELAGMVAGGEERAAFTSSH
jgi:hypothetical protein